MKRFKQSMITGPLLPNIVSYTIPIILTSVLQLLFNAADLVVVGRFRGSVSVGAVGATGSLTTLIVNLFMGLSTGVGVVVAQGIGRRADKSVHKSVHTAIPAAFIIGVVLSVVGVLVSEPLLSWMDTPLEQLPLAATYMQIYFGGMVFTMLYNFVASILRAAGDTKSPLIFLTISGVVNVLLNLVFVVFLDMNVEGVAIATVISQGISAVLVLIALMRRKDACRFEFKKMKIHWAHLGKIVRIGLPAGIQMSLFSISNVLIQSSINSFGDVAVSGNSAATNILGFQYVAINSYSQTSTNFCGQNMGAGRYDRVKKTLLLCCGCVIVTGLTIGVLLNIFGEELLSIYITDSPDAIASGLIRLRWLGMTYFLCGLMDAITGALRGMGSSVVPMVNSVLGVCGIRIVWILTIFTIPAFHTLDCLLVSYPISWGITICAHLIAFVVVYKKQVKKFPPLQTA